MYPGDSLNTIEPVYFCQIATNEKPLTFERKLPLGDVRLRGLLMRVRTICQRGPVDWPSQRLRWQLSASLLFPEVAPGCLIVLCGHLERFEHSRSLLHTSLLILPRTKEGLDRRGRRPTRGSLLWCGGALLRANVDFFDCVC
jgi:hypothetical protein